MSTLEDLIQAKRELSRRLLGTRGAGGVGGRLLSASARRIGDIVANLRSNVHAIGVGKKTVLGRETQDWCVRFYVSHKLAPTMLSARDLLPTTVAGVTTDVIECQPAILTAKRKSAKRKGTKHPSGGTRLTRASAAELPLEADRLTAHAADTTPAATSACSSQRRSAQRPIRAGISVAHEDVTAGTIGYFCRSVRAGDDPQQLYLLSNNHVLADLNAANVGDPVLQPGPKDGGIATHRIADLARFIPLQTDGVSQNHVDCAIAAIRPGIEHVLEICSIGAVNGMLAATVGQLVRKHGRTTAYTEGKIVDIQYDAIVGLDPNNPGLTGRFEDQIRIDATPDSPVIGLGGDSGSMIMDRDSQRAIGLYFAGPADGSYGIANHISDVLAQLEIVFA